MSEKAPSLGSVSSVPNSSAGLGEFLGLERSRIRHHLPGWPDMTSGLHQIEIRDIPWPALQELELPCLLPAPMSDIH